MSNSRFIAPILAVLMLCSGLVAGDFLSLPRCPEPTRLNESGIPVYDSYWTPDNGLPPECSEAIGEEGAELYCKRMGWKKLLTAPDKGKIKQGFDQVWFDSESGKVIVVEAKGRAYRGSSGRHFQLSSGRGQYQTSVEWCIDVCRDALSSPGSTEKSREVAEIVLQAISEDRFESRIIITNHIHGISYDTWTERIVREVPEEYRGLSSEQLRYLVLPKGEVPGFFGDDFNSIQYGNQWERKELRAMVVDDEKRAE